MKKLNDCVREFISSLEDFEIVNLIVSEGYELKDEEKEEIFKEFIKKYLEYSSYNEYIIDELLNTYDYEEVTKIIEEAGNNKEDSIYSEIFGLIHQFVDEKQYRDVGIFYFFLDGSEQEELREHIYELEFERIYEYLEERKKEG